MGALFLNSLGDDTAQPISISEPLLADYERVMGSDHTGTLSWRNNLAIVYRTWGRGSRWLTSSRRP